MTTTTESGVLATTLERGRIALRASGASIKSVALALVAEDVPVEITPDAVPFPPVPKPVTITDEHREAIERLGDVFGKVNITERRVLTPAEIRALYDENAVLKTIEELLAGRRDDVKDIIKHHMDVDAEAAGRAVPKAVVRGGKVVVEPSPRDAAGHYVLGKPQQPERVRVEGTNQEWSREFRAASVTVSGESLKAMEEAGDITREDYLAMTRETRVFDEAKALKALNDKPERLAILAKISKMGKVGSAMNIRKAK